MFSHPFFTSGPSFKLLLEEWREKPSLTTRFTAFMHCAHETFGSFSANSLLYQSKLTCVATAAVQKQPLFLRIHHHFKLELTFDSAAGQRTSAEANDWALSTLPYESISEGVFTLNRDDALVQRYLNLPTGDADAYNGLVYELACRLDTALTPLETVHDVGLVTAAAYP